MDDKKAAAAEYQGLKVIGAGFPRTATTSLHHSLELLGYNPCHTFRNYIVANAFPYTHCRQWQAACLLTRDKPARQRLLHQMYESTGVQAAVDVPTCLFVDDLIEMYPDAKVILGVRSSPGAWRRSFNRTIGRVMSRYTRFATFLFPHRQFALQPLLKRMDDLCRQRYGAAWSDWDDVASYERHNEWVRNVVPKERLLEFEPKMGMTAICEFLEIPVPIDEEGKEMVFPRENEGEGFEKMLGTFEWIGIATWVLAIGGGYGVARWFGYV